MSPACSKMLLNSEPKASHLQGGNELQLPHTAEGVVMPPPADGRLGFSSRQPVLSGC